MNEKILTLFWGKVINPGDWDETKCFIWNDNVDKDGYGRFYYDYKEYKAHRVVYELYIGPISDGKLVCHTCNTPGCVNLRHLYLDTHKGNMEYMSECGRNGNSKLEINDVLDILQNIDNGTYTSVTQIMNHYGISRPNIHDILSGKIWRQVTIKYYTDLDLERLSKKVKRRTLIQSEIDDIKNRFNNGQSRASIARLYNLDFKSVDYQLKKP